MVKTNSHQLFAREIFPLFISGLLSSWVRLMLPDKLSKSENSLYIKSMEKTNFKIVIYKRNFHVQLDYFKTVTVVPSNYHQRYSIINLNFKSTIRNEAEIRQINQEKV